MQLNWHQISLVVAQNSNEVAIVSLEAYAEKYKKGEREQASLRLSHVKFMRLVRIAKEDMHDK